MPRSIVTLLAVLLVDQLDSGMMMPIVPQLLTDAESPDLLIAAGDADSTGMLWVAVLGAAYAVPAFFMQPILGQLADRFGRRRLLLATFSASTLAFLLFAFGITQGTVWLLVVSRFVDGAAAGNLLVAQAAVADVTTDEERTSYYGYLSAALSLGLVLGPLLGGFVGDPATGEWAGPATAFYLSTGLSAASVVAFALLFRETLAEEDRDADEPFALGRALGNAREAFGDERRRPYYLVLLCYIAGYIFFSTFYAVALEERLGMDARQTGWYFAVFGLALMVVQLLLVDRAERWFGPGRALRVALFTAAAAVVLMSLAPAIWVAYAAIVPFALAAGLVEPMVMSLLSKSASASQQGRIQGVRGSVDSLGRIFPPFLAGPIAAGGAASWAMLVGAGVMAVGGVLGMRAKA